LAATVPGNAARSKLRRTLMRHWPEGPQAVRTGVPENILAEPGLIVTLKALALENHDDKPAKPAPAGKNHGHAHGHAAPPREGTGPGSPSGTEWAKLTEELVQGYCRNCYAAARSARRHTRSPASDSRAAAPPLAPHPNSVASAVYHVAWPGEPAAGLPQSADDVLLLDYRRIEQRIKPRRVVAYYRRQLEHCLERPLADGLRLDGFSRGVGGNCARSIDVLITRASTGPPPPGDEEQELTIQILVIEVQEPSE
jgi:hypothetical protein